MDRAVLHKLKSLICQDGNVPQKWDMSHSSSLWESKQTNFHVLKDQGQLRETHFLSEFGNSGRQSI